MNNKLWISVAVGIFSILVVIFFVTKKDDPQNLKNKSPDTLADDSRLREVLNRDREVLQNEDTAVAQKLTAMNRLGMNRDERALSLIMENLESEDLKMRAAALQSGGFYNNAEVFDALKLALEDEEEDIRVAALIGLSRKSGGEVAALILQHLQGQANYSRKEQYHSWLAYVKSETDGEKRKKGYDGLVALGGFMDEAAIQVMRLAPERADVRSLAASKLKTTKNPEVLSMSLSVSARNSLDPVVSRLPELALHENRGVRMTVMDLVSRHCPDRELGESLLEKVVSKDAQSSLIQTKSIKIAGKCGYTAEGDRQSSLDATDDTPAEVIDSQKEWANEALPPEDHSRPMESELDPETNR